MALPRLTPNQQQMLDVVVARATSPTILRDGSRLPRLVSARAIPNGSWIAPSDARWALPAGQPPR